MTTIFATAQRRSIAGNGIPVALNIGDLLLGDGYRMIAECNLSSRQKERMLQVASQGHRNLCLGQGAELWSARGGGVLSSRQGFGYIPTEDRPGVRGRLAPGSHIYSQASAPVHDALVQFSQAVGIAYQIKDDLEDFFLPADSTEPRKIGPSVVLATMIELTKGPEKKLLLGLVGQVANHGSDK